ncbi:hypothetical protein [Bradyrhizobium sp. Gha]|uniref:hypothetical protein n=1 Tax=Bradyrhizobium sp. Gha TaxID=1855318 RepID=UPI000AD5581D|nr:hypothetical protein [Bradyrhizobium sp. Gha]
MLSLVIGAALDSEALTWRKSIGVVVATSGVAIALLSDLSSAPSWPQALPVSSRSRACAAASRPSQISAGRNGSRRSMSGLLHEPLRWNLAAGIVAVFAGIWLATTSGRRVEAAGLSAQADPERQAGIVP